MAGTRVVVGQLAPPTRAPRVDPTTLTDAEIIALSVHQPDLFEEIYRRHHDLARRHVERRVGPDAGADIAAETFVRAFAARDRFNTDYPSARPWLFGIASNLIRHHFRSNRRAAAAHQRLMGRDRVETPDPAPESTTRAAAHLARAEVAKGLQALRERDRELLLAYALSDLTYREIAERAGIPIGTVRSRLARARQRIRQRTEAGLLDLPTD